jgi:Carboxypeptidase regulatory-like domain/TonB dependent receptor
MLPLNRISWSNSEYCSAMKAQFLIVVLLVVGMTGATKAQVLYGSLTGNVTDQAGAVVAGAKVEALNVGTGISTSVATDERGAYQFNNLLPGVYKVTITAQSFKSLARDNIRIDANVVRRLDSQLEVGDVSAIVQISSTNEGLQTDRSDVNTQLESKQITELPITSSSGRNFQALYKIIPGFNTVTEGFGSDGANPQRSMGGNVNGASRQNNLTRIDGASNAYMWLPENTAYVPPSESVQSVNVVTNSYDAEQGNAIGAAVSVVTKSGTNEFHGSVFESHTNNALRARNRFTLPGVGKSKYILNQYGVSLGGPIVKNKLFFFTDWEATKRRQFVNRTATVINPDGIFDAAGNANLAAAIPAGTDCNVTRVTGCVYDPNTGNAAGTGRLAFPGNIIPADRIDPASRAILDRINKSGFLSNAGVTANNNYLSAASATLDRDTNDIKINYVPTEKSTLFGRYSIARANLFDPPLLGDAMGGATGGGQTGTAPSRIQSVGLGGTYTISNRMLIDVNAGYTRLRLGAEYAPDLDRGNFGETIGIPGTNGSDRLAGGIPAFIFPPNSWNGLGNADTGNPFLFRDNQYVANANLTWTRGPHDLRFGMEHTRNGLNHFQPQGGSFQTVRGSFRFNGTPTTITGGPAASPANSLAQFLLGFPNEVGKAVQNTNPNSLRWQTWAAYARDRWQATPKLTINYGVRWEYYPFATSDNSGVRLFDPSTGNVLIGGNGNVPLDNGVDVGHGQLLPRLGIAYRLGSKTVIRAGYGMSADSNNWRFFRNNFPATTNSDFGRNDGLVPIASLTGRTLAPYPNLIVGIPSVALPDTSSGVIPLPRGVNPGNVVPFEFRRGYIHSYNLTLQREFAGFVGEAAYVGTRGIRTLTNQNMNPGRVGGGDASRLLFSVASTDVNCLCPHANSYYDSLQAKVTKRLSGGSYLGAVYTLSKAINSQDNEELGSVLFQGGFLLWAYPEYWNRNKALAGYDRTHNLAIYGGYELPFGPSKRWATKGLVGKLAGGWQLNWLMQRTSGNPLTITGGPAINAPGNAQTPDIVAPISIIGGVGNVLATGTSCAPTDLSCHYFDPSSFRPGPAGRFGTAGRNILRGPGFFNLDASIFRDFQVTESVKLQFRMEMFGVTNTPHFGNPGTDINNPNTFGVITQTLNLAGRGSGTGGERQVWFGAKVMF